jgi:hypothetical protein
MTTEIQSYEAFAFSEGARNCKKLSVLIPKVAGAGNGNVRSQALQTTIFAQPFVRTV